tara:strand:+ start:8 stop:244 length:237 start_codon:yes stop_codon:yes gene_type:complete
MTNQKIPTYTQNVKIIRNIIKNNADHLTSQKLEDLIKLVENWLNNMPEVNSKGVFLANRKIVLSGLLMKLNFIRLTKV